MLSSNMLSCSQEERPEKVIQIVRQLPPESSIIPSHGRGAFLAGQILQFRKPFGTGGYHVSSAYGGIYYFHGYMNVPDQRERFLVLERLDREFSTGGTMFLVNVSEFEVELVRQ